MKVVLPVGSYLCRENVVDTEWQKTFRGRMSRFEVRRSLRPGEVTISIKVRITSGCFHREHSPRAYELIDQHLSMLSPPDAEFAFEEHESGPELLVYLAVGTAVTTLAKSVIDLVTAIIKARSEGVQKGDSPSGPIELIVRRVGDGDEFREEVVLRVGHKDHVDAKAIEEQLNKAILNLLKKSG